MSAATQTPNSPSHPTTPPAGDWKQMIPKFAVLPVLVGLAFWGHHTGWAMPKFSQMLRVEPDAGAADWCASHSVPESICVICNGDEKKPSYGWCKVHGVAECPQCHPDVAQLKETPVVTLEDLERADRALKSMPRKANGSRCHLHTRPIQFASMAAVEKAGIEVEPAWETELLETLSAPGETVYDQNRVAHISIRAPGIVWQARKQEGDTVKKGEVLALVDSTEMGRAKSELLQSVVQVDLKSRAFERLRGTNGAVPERQLHEADAAVREAKIRLAAAQQALVNLGTPVRLGDLMTMPGDEISRRIHFLGIPEDQSSSLDPETTTANLLPLKSPLDGIVVSRHVVAGESVDVGTVVFVVADVSQLWLSLDVRPEDARMLSLGQEVRFQPDAGTGEVRGKLIWVSTAQDEKTRTVKARVELPNPDLKLRAHTYGVGRIVLREEPRAIVVPNEAVEWEGDCNIVFVRDKDFLKEDAPKLFRVRKIRVGAKQGSQTEIIAGVLPGELVVTKGSSVLRAELLRGKMGAGCCEHGH